MRVLSILANGSATSTLARVLLACAGIAFAACQASNADDKQHNGSVAADVAAPAQCGFDPVFPPRDGGAGGSCGVARYALTCVVADAGGGVEECVSDDPTRCDTGTVQTSSCMSDCAPNEYGVACGPPIGDAGETQVLATCRTRGVAPGGHSSYCCPCE